MSIFLMILMFNCENITTKLKISENWRDFSDQWFSFVNLLINDQQYSCTWQFDDNKFFHVNSDKMSLILKIKMIYDFKF